MGIGICSASAFRLRSTLNRQSGSSPPEKAQLETRGSSFKFPRVLFFHVIIGKMSLHPTLSADAVSAYRTTMNKRGEDTARALQIRRERASEIAHQAASILREEFSATKVVLFGSLVHQRWFSATSDVDLAVWGLRSQDYFLAVARLQEISPDFKVDLVDMNNCPDKLKTTISAEGQSL